MPIPKLTPEESEKRSKEVPYIIDPKEVAIKDKTRVQQWCREMMKKHESKLDLNKWKPKDIVASGDVEPEDIDIRNVYPFPNLHWIIYRGGPPFYPRADQCFSIMILSGKTYLFASTWATI